MHKVADLVAARSQLPILHISDVAGSAIAEQGLRRVGLLGTKFVMEESFYRDRLQKNFGIEALVPGQEEQATVHRTIYEELCLGEIEETSRHACFKIIEGVTGQGAQGIVLGCTELPLLIRPGDVRLSLFDTTRLHAEAAVKLALGK